MDKIFKKIIALILIITVGTLISLALVKAESEQNSEVNPNDPLFQNLEQAGTGAKYNLEGSNPTTIPNMIGQIIAVVLGFVGSIFLVLTIYSGIQWMTAGGNEDKVKQARTRLINSIMGLAITIAAYFITWLISTTLLGA